MSQYGLEKDSFRRQKLLMWTDFDGMTAEGEMLEARPQRNCIHRTGKCE
jgi:hypothetical protein